MPGAFKHPYLLAEQELAWMRPEISTLRGFELARQARDRHPSLKVLYTTGQIVDDQMKALYVNGATMLPKPYTDYALKEALEGF
jgi:hypothetical protein